MKADFKAAAVTLQQAARVVVVSHIRPDGDGVGSLLALTRILEKMGKEVTPVLADGLPARYRFLPGAERVSKTLPEQASLTVAVDCSDPERIGFPLERLPGGCALNFDHHATNTRFARTNIVDAGAVATAEVLYDFAHDQGLPLDAELATNLLAGVVTDTIGFRTSNVTPKVLRMAASLIEAGASLADVYDRGLNRRSVSAARYWGLGLVSLGWEDGVVWATLTAEDRKRAGYPGADDADLINLLGTLEGAEVALVLVEQPGGKVKVSWRSRSELDVAALAQQFGGGGHEPAAGAMIEGNLEQVKARVLSATRAFLRPVPGTGQ